MPQHLRISPEYVHPLSLLSDLVCQLAAKLPLCIRVFWCCCACGPSRHFISGCQEKQTPVPRPFLGPGQSVVIFWIWGLCTLCSVMSYLRVSHSLYQDVMLSFMISLVNWCSYTSKLPSLKFHWGDHQIFLAIFIVLKTKEVGVLLSMLVITNCRSKQNWNPSQTLWLIHSFCGQRVKFMPKL